LKIKFDCDDSLDAFAVDEVGRIGGELLPGVFAGSEFIKGANA
tara:strand:+ start:403 stop:531 length:129 start_codon:yes stop_codon:yes gene_type:complete